MKSQLESNDAFFRKKKSLGQHFLKDANTARKVADGLTGQGGYEDLLEIGPGIGALTQHLLKMKQFRVWCVETDREAIPLLKERFPELEDRLLEADFLSLDISEHFSGQVGIVGNFPYNISSQILFKVYEYRQQVPEMVGMFQKEVAERVAAPPGSKIYGKTSVLLQAFYDVEYLFSVSANVFSPPPKVKSGVIRLRRNHTQELPCDEALFFRVVKQAFERRRKTLRNALKPLIGDRRLESPLLSKRAEQLGVEEFVEVVRMVE